MPVCIRQRDAGLRNMPPIHKEPSRGPSNVPYDDSNDTWSTDQTVGVEECRLPSFSGKVIHNQTKILNAQRTPSSSHFSLDMPDLNVVLNI